MSTSKDDFASLGLTADEWQAFILGRGAVLPHKLDTARAALARLGGYTKKRAADTQFMNKALRTIATRFPSLWLEGETLTAEENIRFVQAARDCSREEAEGHLEQVQKDREEEARILGKRA